MTTADRAEVEDFAQQSLQLLERARKYVADGDLHQASEKAWGAAAHMAKAVAAANGWTYEKHSDFSFVLNNTWLQTGDDRIRELRGIPNDLHGYHYVRNRFLNADVIAPDIESVAELVEILAPLTE
ncbi:MAG: HEPN domain-containing protein [Chloroflexi bacterium]|nr:HEPN domain-containing protein [Chloroflexota bacterium]